MTQAITPLSQEKRSQQRDQTVAWHQGITPLSQEKRSNLPTDEAAYHLNREPQTLRIWAMSGKGAVTPIRVGGRLAWPVEDIKRVLGVA